jgi:xanthine/uracil permease
MARYKGCLQLTAYQSVERENPSPKTFEPRAVGIAYNNNRSGNLIFIGIFQFLAFIVLFLSLIANRNNLITMDTVSIVLVFFLGTFIALTVLRSFLTEVIEMNSIEIKKQERPQEFYAYLVLLAFIAFISFAWGIFLLW